MLFDTLRSMQLGNHRSALQASKNQQLMFRYVGHIQGEKR